MRYTPSQRVKDRWKTVTDELEEFFKDYPLPTETIQLSKCERIDDVKKFVETELNTIRAHQGNINFSSSVTRLQKLKTHLKTNIRLAA